MFEKILVGLDGSPLAEQILPYVTETCLRLKSEVVLLQVVTAGITISPPQSIHVPPFRGKIKPDSVPVSDIAGEFNVESQVEPQLEEIEREQSDTKVYLEKLARPLRREGLKVKTAIVEGEPASSIAEYADKNKISLIALTSHGEGGAKRAGLGNVAQSLLKSSNLPILIIKPK